MSTEVTKELIDWHTHCWLPEHLGPEHLSEMNEAFNREDKSPLSTQLAKKTGGRTFEASPEQHRAAMEGVSKFVVVGIKWGRLGANVPNKFTAEYVSRYPGRAIGFASVDPNDPSAADEFEHSVKELGLRGLKLSTVYQGFDPWESPAWQLYDLAQDLDVPIMFHQGSAIPAQSVLDYSNPILLDKVARSFPRLRIIVAHFGAPWNAETVAVMRKHRTVFADLSGRYYRRWQLYNGLQLAIEYNVTEQLLFGSDFPMQTARDAEASFKAINDFGEDVRLPRIADQVVEDILYRRPFELLGI